MAEIIKIYSFKRIPNVKDIKFGTNKATSRKFIAGGSISFDSPEKYDFQKKTSNRQRITPSTYLPATARYYFLILLLHKTLTTDVHRN